MMPLQYLVITNNLYRRKIKIDLIKVENKEKKEKKERKKKFRYYFCKCSIY